MAYGFQEPFFFSRQDGIGEHFPLHFDNPLKVFVYIHLTEPFRYPIFEMGVLTLVDIGIKRGELVDLSAVVVEAPENFQAHWIFQVLHGKQVLRFMGQ